MSQVKTEGFIFSSVNFRETSRIIQVFTKELGVISILIRGASKPGISTENFDLFSKSSFVLYKPHSGEIYKYKESYLLIPGIDFSRNVKTFYRISMIFKIILKILPHGNSSPEIYGLTDKVLAKMRKYIFLDQNKLYVFYFLLALLKIEGYGSNYHTCSVCKRPFTGRVFFSPAKSEFLCNECNSSGENIPLDRGMIKLMENLSDGALGKMKQEVFLEYEDDIWRIISISFANNFDINLENFKDFL